nr:triose-phosphate isomerase [Psychrobacter sp. PraFG1]UNK05529.1 triose-phosphate isomerase [Psychrobacter sp. PraFG1]
MINWFLGERVMKSWVIGNWKLNPTSLEQVQHLVTDLVEGVDAQTRSMDNCHLMLAPSFLHLSPVQQALNANSSTLKLAAQDVSALSAESGAYTGDVSAKQLKDMGVQWVIVGHSERRQYYKESNAVLLKKLLNSAEQGLGVILCIGESESDFEAGHTEQVLDEQLQVIADFLQQLKPEQAGYAEQNLIIAYEPVWAIGTGKVPSVEQVTQIHRFIRQQLHSFDNKLDTTPVIYGGSVKPENAADFAASDQINGVLVGGAALQADSFLAIAKCFNN